MRNGMTDGGWEGFWDSFRGWSTLDWVQVTCTALVVAALLTAAANWGRAEWRQQFGTQVVRSGPLTGGVVQPSERF